MRDETTRLQFEATLGGVQVKQPKGDGYSTPKGAELQLSLTVQQPAVPTPPRSRSWRLSEGRPEIPSQEDGEDDTAYDKRAKVAVKEQAEWDALERDYQRAVAEHAGEVQAMRDRTLAFAQLVGIAAVFGNKPVTATIEPADQDLLPGFQAVLIAPPSEAQQ